MAVRTQLPLSTYIILMSTTALSRHQSLRIDAARLWLLSLPATHPLPPLTSSGYPATTATLPDASSSSFPSTKSSACHFGTVYGAILHFQDFSSIFRLKSVMTIQLISSPQTTSLYKPMPCCISLYPASPLCCPLQALSSKQASFPCHIKQSPLLLRVFTPSPRRASRVASSVNLHAFP
jgi:hypothetical protein